MSRSVLATAIVAVVSALSLQVICIFRQSFTADEPYFLFAGYRAVRFGQNTLNLEHPPLVAMLAAIPFAHLDSTTDNPYSFVFANTPQARWIRLSSRFVLWFAFAIPFLWCCFHVAREMAGIRAGVVVLLIMASSFSIFPYLTVVQTDTAASLGYMFTLLAIIRFMRIPNLQRAITVGLGLGLTLTAKFSGLLLLPTVLVTVFLANSPELSWKRRCGFLCLIIVLSGGLLHLTYRIANWNYDSKVGREAIRRYCENQATLVVDDRLRRYENLLLSIEDIAPMEAQWLTGVLGIATQNRLGIYATHVFDTITSRGRWWFFPILFLIKTPLVLLILYVWALFAFCFQRESLWKVKMTDPTQRRIVFVLFVTMGMYCGTAIFSTYNLGIRHLLPVMPLLLFPVAAWISQRLMSSSVLIGLLLTEAITLTPLWMTATNTWWLGEKNPTYCAVISDCEYKQNFLPLAAAARERSLVPLHIAFPLFTEFERKILTPAATIVDPKAPLTPGWHAVNIYIERFLPLVLQTRPEEIHNYDMFANIAQLWSSYSAEIRRHGVDHGYIAGTFHLYYVPLVDRQSCGGEEKKD